MNLPIPKKLWKETYLYASDKSLDELRATMKASIDKHRNYLDGAFNTPNSFRLNSNWRFGIFQGSFDPASGSGTPFVFLDGEIFQQSGRTFVRTTLRPNMLTTVMFFLQPALALVLFFCVPRDATNPNEPFLHICFAAFFFLGPLTMYFLSVIPKRQLRKRFLRTFALEQVSDDEAP
jgi:hypothetical protein